MSSYTLHQTIHELLPQLNLKYGLKLEVESDYFVSENGNKYHNYQIPFTEDGNSAIPFIPAIQAPQIRQILLGLQNLLGLQIYEFEQNNLCFAEDGNGKVLQPLIDREPDQVLQELIEIIKELLK